MLPRPHRIRRARRTDFVAVMEILAMSDLPTPPPDRATLRRFRHVVADLGTDVYVATVDERLMGLVHATYARQIATGPHVRIELLVVAPDVRRRGIGTTLVRHIEARAQQRTCVQMTCDMGRRPERTATLFFTGLSWLRDGNTFHTALASAAEPKA